MKRYYMQIIEFDGTNDLWLKQSTETLGSGGDTEKDNLLLKGGIPESISQELDISENTSTISSIFISFVNNDSELSELIYEDFYESNNFYNKKCVIGYYDTVSTNKNEIYTGYFKDLTHDIYETYYEFELQDNIEKLKALSLENTNAGNDVFDLDTLLSENPTTGYTGTFSRFGRKENSGHDSSYLYNYEDETDQTTFNDWESDKWIILSYSGHPIDLIKYFCSSAQLDILYDNVSFEAVRDDSKNTAITSLYFEWKEPIKDTYKFMVEQIFKPLNCYPLIKEDGKLYLGLHKQPTVFEATEVLDEDNSKITKNSPPNRNNIINNGFIGIDYNIEENKYINLVYDVENPNTTFNTDSVEAFGLQPKTAETIGFQGINSKAVISTDSTLGHRIDFCFSSLGYLFDRFSLSTKKISIDVIFSVGGNIDIGDLVILQGFKIMQWKGDGKATRGLPIVSTDEYGKVGDSYWGEYVSTYEDNEFLDDKTSGKSIEVEEIIVIEFFEGLLENYNYNLTFLTQHERN